MSSVSPFVALVARRVSLTFTISLPLEFEFVNFFFVWCAARGFLVTPVNTPILLAFLASLPSVKRSLSSLVPLFTLRGAALGLVF